MVSKSIRISAFAAAAAALFGAPAYADETAFVNVAGQRPVALAAAAGSAGDPAIEKLLTRPSDLWERLRQGFAMPDLDSRLVAVHEAWYAARPELLRGILARARRYLHYIVEEIDRRGLPTELALLPAVESGFNPMALSSAQASGLWQFIPHTGARYKLEQTAHFDARPRRARLHRRGARLPAIALRAASRLASRARVLQLGRAVVLRARWSGAARVAAASRTWCCPTRRAITCRA